MPHPAGLFCDVEDTLRMVVVRFDALELAGDSSKKQRADDLSETCRILVQKVEYDRSCGTQIEWSELYEHAQSVCNSWMRCMLNGVGMSDEDFQDLAHQIELSRAHLTASFT